MTEHVKKKLKKVNEIRLHNVARHIFIHDSHVLILISELLGALLLSPTHSPTVSDHIWAETDAWDCTESEQRAHSRPSQASWSSTCSAFSRGTACQKISSYISQPLNYFTLKAGAQKVWKHVIVYVCVCARHIPAVQAGCFWVKLQKLPSAACS